MKDFISFSEEHKKAVAKGRREILHFDAFGRCSLGEVKSIEDFMKQQFEYIDNLPHQIDSIFWDIMYSGDEHSIYPSDILPQRTKGPMVNLIKEGVDFFEKFTTKGIELGVENILVHRISEIDILEENAHKQEHPEMYIKSWLWNGLHNLEKEEIRIKKLDILKECIYKYPFDGLEIDFLRHTPFLPPGKQWELRENVTEFMRMLRNMLLEAEGELKRPLLLSARVPETLEGCRIDGIDIKQWSEERLVDCLTLGARNFDVDIEDFRKATAKSGIKLFPCFDAHHTVDGYAEPPIEVYRGVFCNWWDRGADGIKLFNWHTASRDTYERTFGKRIDLPQHCQDKALIEAGDYEAMRFQDKAFVLERKGGYPWGEGYANHNLEKPLPKILPNNGRETNLNIFISDSVSCFPVGELCVKLRLVIFNMEAQDSLIVFINGFEVPGKYNRQFKDKFISAPGETPTSGYGSHNLPKRKDQRLTCFESIMDAGILFKGLNNIEISLIRNGKYENCSKVILEKVEISITYSDIKN